MNSALRRFTERRVVIIAAPNGARRSQHDYPALPVTACELAEEAAALRDAGASVVHLHVRDADARHTLDPGLYREALAAIRARIGNELVVQVTTEAVGRYSPAEQMALVRELRPEAVSLALRELCPEAADEPVFGDFCQWMSESGVWPQFILYDQRDVQRFDAMRKSGVIQDDSPFALFVLGRYADAVTGTVADLDSLLDATDPGAFPWAVCCFGSEEHVVMRAALERGGHVRIGFENNVLLRDGTPAPDNSALIREFTTATRANARRPATAGDVRKVFMTA